MLLPGVEWRNGNMVRGAVDMQNHSGGKHYGNRGMQNHLNADIMPLNHMQGVDAQCCGDTAARCGEYGCRTQHAQYYDCEHQQFMPTQQGESRNQNHAEQSGKSA